MKTTPLRIPSLYPLLAAISLLAANAPAAVITLQNGVSPTTGYSGATSTFIRSDNPTTNYSTYLDATHSQFIVGNTSAGADIRSLLSFNLSVLPANATINSATLTLTTAAADATSSNTLVQLDLLSLTTAFTASQATWNNYATGSAWTTPGGDYNPTILSSLSLNPVTIPANTASTFASSASLVSSLQSAYNASSSVELMVKLDNETGTTRNIFFFVGDGSTPTGTYRPSLTIDYTVVPEPSTAALLGGAFVVGVLVRRRKR